MSPRDDREKRIPPHTVIVSPGRLAKFHRHKQTYIDPSVITPLVRIVAPKLNLTLEQEAVGMGRTFNIARTACD